MTTLFIMLAGFLFSALFSGVETGSYMINRIRLRQRERERKPSALLLAKLLESPHLFIFTVLIGNNIAVFLLSKEVTDAYLAGGMVSGGRLLGFIPWNAETAATLTLMFPLFLFAEVGPKNLFRKKADTLMYRVAGLIRALVWLFYPFTWPLKELFRILTHGLEKDPVRDLHRLSSDALREYFSASEKEGVISSDQNRMVDNVTSMHEVSVSMLMTPFKKVPTLPGHATVADFKQLVSRGDTSQAILMDKHTAIGLVSLFPLVKRRLEDGDRLRPYAEDVLKLQEKLNLKSVFYRLRRNHQHCAVVVDVHNHPVGFIRLEDIARYIAMK
jgi:CBS domain containing-hemolysin-like protein